MPEEVTETTVTTETTVEPEGSILGGEQLSETPEVKAEDSAEAKKSDEPTKSEEKPAVPEKYEFKAPEGMTLDEAAVQAFEPVAKELGLTQDAAQKLVDLYASQKAADAKALADGWALQGKTWSDEVKADKEFGGPNFPATMNNANTVLKQFSTPEEIAAINAMGLGNYPPFVRALARIGKAIGEDSLVKGKAASAADLDPAKVLFPNNA